jgi:hypothetical protein
VYIETRLNVIAAILPYSMDDTYMIGGRMEHINMNSIFNSSRVKYYNRRTGYGSYFNNIWYRNHGLHVLPAIAQDMYLSRAYITSRLSNAAVY